MYVEAKSQEKALLNLQLIAETLTLPLQHNICRPYWQDPNQYEIGFITTWEHVDAAEAVFRTLAVADTLAWEWSVRSPVEWDNGMFEFGGQSTKTKLSNLAWVGFELTRERMAEIEG